MIESYLNQEMNDLDRSRFEKMIHQDPELHDEVEFQQTTIDVIKKERVLALKAGLSQVPVSLWSLGLMQAAKVAAISLGIGLVSVGGYFGMNYLNRDNQSGPVGSNAQVEKSIKAVQTTPTQPQAISSPQVSKKENEVDEVAKSKSFESNSENAEIPSPANASKSSSAIKVVSARENGILASPAQKTNSETEVREPGTTSPGMPVTQDISLPEDGITKKTSLESIHPEVVFKRNNRDNFHYQFSDSKLVLYADFNYKIYEVLELNQSGKKRLFLAYDGKFFGLDVNQTNITPLEEVKEGSLIQVLMEYQKRKN